ncbi:tRNA1(Val) (adenine(37)-N6)-methyltransferase [Paracoccus aerodenitrificans]|uniref:tRNA1(Val) (adenine(37)-N6)-methyltransferase n=1 Tax=Paracoccus aerodenitrificans TaxID=3017781 RepID=UPI0022F02F05|nr:methyltransferase [Paracoccus aerodenitrificans]WBU64351.1 methyltransferase [Paracoccus aerodenitrificans]
MNNTRIDDFLGGRLRIEQPVSGYRAGADAVMLAAACAAQDGDAVLELGCGAGVASLCLQARVAGVSVTGVERGAGFAELARANAARNHSGMSVIRADLADLPRELRERSFDHVMMNPPYFPSGTASPDRARAEARHEDTPLAIWLDTALRRLRPGGTVTVIHLASRLSALLEALQGRTGDIRILPIAARAGRDAGRVILSARKNARGTLRLLAPFVMHAAAQHSADGEDLTDEAQAILRCAAGLNLDSPNARDRIELL